jgi:hypothetical protein
MTWNERSGKVALSEMNSKEKTIVAVLGVIIVIALIGIGFLVAKLVADGGTGGQATGIVVAETSPAETSSPEATFTPVAPASVEGLPETTPAPVSDQPVAVVRAESLSPGLPALLVNQPLHGDRRYRLEVTAADGSAASISGSWSQAATGGAGEAQADIAEPIDGATPFTVDVQPPVANPQSWSLSASVGPKDLLGSPPGLVITVWDVTGTQ